MTSGCSHCALVPHQFRPELTALLNGTPLMKPGTAFMTQTRWLKTVSPDHTDAVGPTPPLGRNSGLHGTGQTQTPHGQWELSEDLRRDWRCCAQNDAETLPHSVVMPLGELQCVLRSYHAHNQKLALVAAHINNNSQHAWVSSTWEIFWNSSACSLLFFSKCSRTKAG